MSTGGVTVASSFRAADNTPPPATIGSGSASRPSFVAARTRESTLGTAIFGTTSRRKLGRAIERPAAAECASGADCVAVGVGVVRDPLGVASGPDAAAAYDPALDAGVRIALCGAAPDGARSVSLLPMDLNPKPATVSTTTAAAADANRIVRVSDHRRPRIVLGE